MTGEFISSFYVLLIIFPYLESCSLPPSIPVSVPSMIPAQAVIYETMSKGQDPCDTVLYLPDPRFKVGSQGAIVASSAIKVPSTGLNFTVWVQDSSGQRHKTEIALFRRTLFKREVADTGLLRRSKRRWAPPPFHLKENALPPFPKKVEEIGSDSEAKYKVYYVISGPGVDQHPVGLFTLDKLTGTLFVQRAVDREEFPEINFLARVFERGTDQEKDIPLDITVIIEDENDNAPTFTDPLQFTCLEKSKPGSVVGKVNATDRDQQKMPHTEIKYSLLTGTDKFAIDSKTGVITVVSDNLDREVQDKHLVTVQIKDMNGATNGLTNTATATITLGDINDNAPTFRQPSYKAAVQENQRDGLILRIPVDDKDLENTPNCNCQFVIAKGNENGNFRIETDSKTNEGLLYLVKPFDYEKTKKMTLEIMAKNEVDLVGTKAPWATVPVEVNVGNVDEGPEFTAPTVTFTVKENSPNGTQIGTYTALDPETKSSAGIKYYKVKDPASWIDVDTNSGALRVANTIDRESHFVQNGIYNITVKAVDASLKTGTGTVIIQVVDVNDHIPQLPTKELVVCEKEGVLGSTVVTADDRDQSPSPSPFNFELLDDDGKWAVKYLNGTAITLEQKEEHPTGIYKVPMMVKDLQGKGERQEVTVRICQCWNNVCLTKERSTALGKWGILSLLLGLALVLLFGLLCIFFCTTKSQIKELDVGDSGGILLKSNTEGRGEEVLLTDDSTSKKATYTLKDKDTYDQGWMGTKSTSTIGGHSIKHNGLHQPSGFLIQNMQNNMSSNYEGKQFGTGQFGGQQMAGSDIYFDSSRFSQFQNSSAHQTWRTHGYYLQKKLAHMGGEEEGCYADDILHSYGYEGAGSGAGSVGCCSDMGEQDNLDFLNTLGPKFRPLAKISTNK